mmetsp:Transcript_39483/g.111691  ORF Transcript_39483/g.111691 Transcript_39483/m.111691 type:complete len:203 (+) Transcript_39483:170-778(+)
MASPSLPPMCWNPSCPRYSSSSSLMACVTTRWPLPMVAAHMAILRMSSAPRNRCRSKLGTAAIKTMSTISTNVLRPTVIPPPRRCSLARGTSVPVVSWTVLVVTAAMALIVELLSRSPVLAIANMCIGTPSSMYSPMSLSVAWVYLRRRALGSLVSLCSRPRAASGRAASARSAAVALAQSSTTLIALRGTRLGSMSLAGMT